MFIYKYQLRLTETQTISINSNARLLTVQMQNGVITLWAMVDIKAPKEDRVFYIVGTGSEATYMVDKLYVGTVQANSFVWHIFTTKDN